MLKNNAVGYSLLMMLIFLLVLSTLSIYSLSATKDWLRNTQEGLQSKQALLQAQQELRKLQSKLSVVKTRCVLINLPSYELILKPRTWLEACTCSGNSVKMRYYYAVELLSKDPCATFDNAKQPSAVNFFRLTLFAFPEQPSGMKIILQSTHALADDAGSPCFGSLHLVHLGQLNQRELVVG